MQVSVPDLNDKAMTSAAERQGRLAKPAGSLGRLEGLSVWLAGAQGVDPPRDPDRVRVVLFAGDHGVAAHGVSIYPQAQTAQLVAEVHAGGAAVSVLAHYMGASVRVEDMAVGRASGSIDLEDAITDDEALAAYERGQRLADSEVDAGADLLVVGNLGVGISTPAAVIVASLTANEPVAVVGRGGGIDDDGWMRKTAAVRDAMRRVRVADAAIEPMRLLAVAGGADLAATVGFLVQAATRRTPVVLDGLASCACALLAERIAPGLSAWQVAGHLSTEPAHGIALRALRHEALLDLRMNLAEGSGALLAVPLLRAAVATLAEMAEAQE